MMVQRYNNNSIIQNYLKFFLFIFLSQDSHLRSTGEEYITGILLKDDHADPEMEYITGISQ
jgi:hypothetical protein